MHYFIFSTRLMDYTLVVSYSPVNLINKTKQLVNEKALWILLSICLARHIVSYWMNYWKSLLWEAFCFNGEFCSSTSQCVWKSSIFIQIGDVEDPGLIVKGPVLWMKSNDTAPQKEEMVNSLSGTCTCSRSHTDTPVTHKQMRWEV